MNSNDGDDMQGLRWWQWWSWSYGNRSADIGLVHLKHRVVFHVC